MIVINSTFKTKNKCSFKCDQVPLDQNLAKNLLELPMFKLALNPIPERG